MKDQALLNNRLTIQEFRLPFDKQYISPHKKSKASIAHYQSEKRVLCNPQDRGLRLPLHQRQSQELQRTNEDLQKVGNLPEIRNKSRTLEVKKPLQERLHSFSSRKLSVNIYHKIEKSISSKYSLKMETLAANSLKPKKLFSINNLKTDLPARRSIMQKAPREWHEKGVHKSSHFAIIEKHHIDRLKDQFQIPLELQTQKCQEQEYDNHQVNLQIKNMIRFQYTQLHFKNKKQNEKSEENAKIDAWEFEHPHRATHLYS